MDKAAKLYEEGKFFGIQNEQQTNSKPKDGTVKELSRLLDDAFNY